MSTVAHTIIDMHNRYYDVQGSLGFLTVTTNRLMSAFFRKRLIEAGIDLTPEQWGVLAQLWNRGSIPQDELALALCVDKSSLSRVLDVMERRGLVVRRRDPDDARRKILFPSSRSEPLKERCQAIADETMKCLLRKVSAQDHEACIRVLAQVKETIKELSE